ncbi:rho GTPase-activating protein 30 [Pimephales promelas]|uniref:rho GTPase-activating protein 30 n=1 Tax=Pimephales promelas TaxID=90988 RepID=UPI0019558AD7|nr:rho GTPase-activating protein 30 [Pimephales promelas]XP_039517037.1 rho GTPase-activating protein 30 [Pimephales promelas]XP_039517038.1 rho GTPase-activating protein 30 [Pimephales promelas]XP_039517039.1 rho GTPase-activating protein 30 [Pimephales promelas]
MRRGRRKGGNREKVFGCDLLEHLTSTAQDIPQVLRSCGEFIEEHGVVDGIYRLSGVSSNTQKLRSEFDTEGCPDLNKDVYLQDIHCVSSVCKAYFRELPNPLLTYELYDRFADAVAIQLEDERLVKIREVLKDLPALHYRTLEYLMRHLVKMSTFASETNMHSRNLAIVWAPNLLRSKDIESTGFNGTAAFMEVRVQSIVVEFILTHVAELFPGTGLSVERRKSLPSPSLLPGDDHFFKSLPLHCPGNLSPGDGPPAMRSYHAIIDGTDKRKGSLKGRKWKSIFNLGGRLHDPRKKSKYCPKDKEKTTLRPAKSMDSLSCGPFPAEDSKHPPAHLPPLLLASASGSSEGVASAGGGVASAGGGVSSGYAVTYRRTGGAQVSMVSGGTPGTYNRLDSGGGANGAEGASQGVSRSPAMTSKADRRAGIHISGPFSVTVPLHITSGLALGVLHGGWSEKEQTVEEDEDVKSKHDDVHDESKREISVCLEEAQVDCGKNMVDIKEETVPEDGHAPSDKEDQILNQESVKKEEDPIPEVKEEDYMEMKGNHPAPASPRFYEDMEFPDQELPMDLQEAFGFLDSMDNSASNQVEFSVEAPCFETEYEEEEDQIQDNRAASFSLQNCTNDCEKTTHRLIPGKSHSLPYKSRPFLPALSSSSSDDDYSPADDDDDDEESDKGSEYEDMFCHSLPSSRCFQGLSWSGPETTASSDVAAHCSSQSECSDGMQNALSKDADQSEDVIPTDNSENSVHLSSGELNTDEHQKEEDAGNEKHTLIREDEASDEDTYFGPDSIPSSPEPKTAANELPGAGYHGNSEVTTNELTVVDCISLAPRDPPSEKQTAIMSEDEDGINRADTEEGQCDDDDDEEHADEKEVSATERREDLEGNSGEEKEGNSTLGRQQDERNEDLECEEEEEEPVQGDLVENTRESEIISTDEIIKGEQDERKEDLEEKREECEEEEQNSKDETTKEGEQDERKDDLEDNSGECEEENSINETVKEGEQDLVENTRESEIISTGEQDERKEDLEEKREEFEEENSTKEEEQELEENSGECEEEENSTVEFVKERQEDERSEDLMEKAKTEPVEEGEESPEEEEEEEVSLNTDACVIEEMVEGPDEAEEIQREENDSISSTTPKRSANQVKAVPAVPPKPQNSKLTALALRQQFEHRHAADGAQEEDAGPRARPGSWDGVVDRRKDLHREAERDGKRNSGVSMCFDEAVARATEKRSREKENTDRLSGAHWDRDSRKGEN